MKAITTVVGFCKEYLELNQTVVISDYDTDMVYFTGKVKDILANNKCYMQRIKMIHASYHFESPHAIELEI